MIRVYDFTCDNGHTHERFISTDATDVVCETCGAIATRELSAPHFTLEGCSGSFPGAAMKWEKNRAQKQRIQEEKERSHGDTGWTY